MIQTAVNKFAASKMLTEAFLLFSLPSVDFIDFPHLISITSPILTISFSVKTSNCSTVHQTGGKSPIIKDPVFYYIVSALNNFSAKERNRAEAVYY